MSEEKRLPESQQKPLGKGGPFLAKVVGHLDPSFMGGLEVTLQREASNRFGEDAQTYEVRCAVPFFGSTNLAYTGVNTGNDQAFNDTQKSYGMWFVPPDVGVTVLVIFIDGNPAEGYWIGCIPDRFENHMVPAIACSKNVDYSQTDRQKYEPNLGLPVAEMNKSINADKANLAVDKLKRPVHPFAEALLKQGLLLDDIRGVSTSTPRRNVPSSVFGISTPGPLDQKGKKASVGRRETKSPTPVPISRLGGTQLVMDDGDDRFIRKTKPSDGPPTYVSSAPGATGEVNIPVSEYFRVRTRTGHQILLHNSEDLIYIGNASGTSWIEMSSNGKIDIFANDSVSVHTKQDFNLRADRDINIEAGRNINMKSVKGRTQIETGTDFLSIVGNDFKSHVKKEYHLLVDSNSFIDIKGDSNSSVTGKLKINSNGTFSLKTTVDLRLQAGTNTNIKSGGKHIEEAARIEMNCDPAASAESSQSSTKPVELTLHKILVTNEKLVWADTQYKSQEPIESIVKRMPMHEPWADHENLDPVKFKPENTDRDVGGE
jgi:hypothetical protein